MPRKGSDAWLNTILNKYVKAPAIVILGMAVVGILIDSFANTQNTFTIIFVILGGVGAVAYYFWEFWQHKN